MTRGHCETCKHWDDKSHREWGSMKEGWGFCVMMQSDEFVGGHPDSLAVAYGYEGPAVRTAEKFGCVMYKANA